MTNQNQNMVEIAKNVSKILKIMANENRLMILCVLIESPLTVSEIQEHVGQMLNQKRTEESSMETQCSTFNENTQSGISQSALSQHLALLKAHDIVKAQKNGQFVQYSLKDTKIAELMGTLKELYCK